MEKIPAILVLEGNKTYGRTPNKKRMLYKCIPAENTKPPVLVPYDLPLGFTKQFINRYILYEYQPSTIPNPNPNPKLNQNTNAIIVENIGEVSDLEAFVKYRIHCRKLFTSMAPFTKRIRVMNVKDILTNRIIQNPNYKITECPEPVITIDPEGCLDFDDGFSVVKSNIIRIHIANPAIMIDAMQLWEKMPNPIRTTTLYLPHKKEPMLPPILSEDWCSLRKSEEPRIAFTLEAEFNEDGEVIHENTRLFASCIRIKENYVYESPECMVDKIYTELKSLAEKRTKRELDSHEVVEHWMVFMNEYCGKTLAESRTGIFRTAQYIAKEREIPEHIHFTKDMQKVIKDWGRISGNYSLWEPGLEHVGLQMGEYVHITSPIRRMVDMVNQMILMKQEGIEWSAPAESFIETNLKDITVEEINRQNKESRKLQRECEDLWWVTRDPEVVNQIYTGIIFDTNVVYIKELKKIVYVKLVGERDKEEEKIEKYSEHNFRPYYFENEGKTYKKIRWQIIK